MRFGSCIHSGIRCVCPDPLPSLNAPTPARNKDEGTDFPHFHLQLTKEQLLSVLPLLVRHLGSENYVCYTYAAITIDRILFIKRGTQLLCVPFSFYLFRDRADWLTGWWDRFTQADIHEIAPQLLDAVLNKIEGAGTAEKVAENDYLMKCTLISFRHSFRVPYCCFGDKARCE